MRLITVFSVLAVLSSAAPAKAQVENVPSLPTPASVFLEDLTWVELRDAIAAGKTTVIIPTGGTEQNGPIMVLGKHNYLVRYKAGEIAKQLGNAIVAPVMAYVPEGDIPGAKPAAGHMRFPGTITTPEDAYEKVLEYAARSLKSAGFLDIAMIGDSGGNQTGQKVVSEMLNKEWAGTTARVHHITDYYPGRGDAIAAANGMSQEAIGSHAGSQDTTSLMYINPGMLRFDKFTLGKANDGQGHVGDARYSTAIIGKLILEAQVEDAVKQIKSLRMSSRNK
jgi:creatinine amidohydrolase/Fe(II)-dependent formamide hydrolase-like protein